MNRRLRNRIRMLHTVLAHVDEHPDVWSDKPPIARNVAAVRATTEQIDATAEAQAAGDTQGLTENKRRARRAAVDALLDLGRKVAAYAIETGDADLRQAADRSRTDWRRMPDATFAAEAADLFRRVEAAPDGALDEYGVGATEVEDARAAVAEVGRLGEIRDNVGIDVSVATEDLDELYDDTAEPLEVLDRLVPALIDDEGFVDEYARARRIPGD